jgi:hypothetical protein
MPLDFEALSNWDFEEIEQTLTERDTILYALGLGFGEDPTDKKELAYVYEDGLKTVPSMAVTMGYPGFWLRDPKTGVNWQQVLHGEQWLDIYKPLPTHGRIVGRSKIDFISDKGEGKGAVIYQSRDIIDADSGEKLARVAMSAFCRGDGGFDGENKAGLTARPITSVKSKPCRAKRSFIASAAISIRFTLTRMSPVLSGSTARSCTVWRPMVWPPGRSSSRCWITTPPGLSVWMFGSRHRSIPAKPCGSKFGKRTARPGFARRSRHATSLF